MISSTIYGTLNVSSKPPVASSRSLQWTPDGQLLVLGETIIYILTPEMGLKFDQDASPPRSNIPSNIQWSTTAIPLPATELYWPEVSQDWSALCIGAMDYSWQAITYSPTNYSIVGSCMLATLSSNLEVLLWAPRSHAYRGEWSKIQDVTERLRIYLQETDSLAGTRLALSSSIHALAWSSQLPTARSKKASLLALGNAAGTVYFLRVEDGNLQIHTSYKVADTWITEMRWTQWKESKDSATAVLACEISKREIRLLTVQLVWTESGDLNAVISHSEAAPFENDRRSITALEWVESDGEGPILAHCKPGTVHIWRENGRGSWEGIVSLYLRLQSTSTASTHLCQASGISYLPQHDTIVVTLVDGSFHAIHNISKNPALQNEEDTFPCKSADMSHLARLAFLVAEEKEKVVPKDGSEAEKIYRNHVAKTTGALGVDSAGVFVWMHQRIFSESFEFTPDAKTRSMVIVAPLVAPNDYDSYAMQELVTSLSKPRNFFLESPVAILRGAYIHLRRKGFVARNKQRLLELLETESKIQVSSFEMLDQPMDGPPEDEWRATLCEELSKALFANYSLCRVRLKLNMAMVCCTAFPKDDAFGQLVLALQRQIHRACLRAVFEMLRVVPPTSVQDSSMMFASMMLKKAHVASMDGYEAVEEVRTTWECGSEPERCPACGATVDFEDNLLAECENGHYWGRCSATSYILSTPDVRSCICCGRKMMVVTESASPMEDWVCHVILEATDACINCGNKCVKTV